MSTESGSLLKSMNCTVRKASQRSERTDLIIKNKYETTRVVHVAFRTSQGKGLTDNQVKFIRRGTSLIG